MSHEASNWVLRQRSRSSSTQCLLLVIANAADPEGVAFGWWKSRDHWWPYLVERTRLSRGTLFKLLNELEDLGYFTREEAKPAEGGKAQPVIRLHIDRDVMEPEQVAEWDSQSPRETEEDGRTPPETPSQSPRETETPPIESPRETGQSETETQNAVTSLPGRLAESPRETARDVPLLNPITPQSPPLAKPMGLDEANGFGAFWNDYPDHQAMNRDSALKAFADLTGAEQQQAVKTVSFYARDITKLKRRPVSPANWLKGKRFNEYGSGRQTAGTSGALQLVKEGTEPWQAWCNVAAVGYGGGAKIPYHWGSQEHRGAWRPSQWPQGGEAWLTPLKDWIFVESGTAQHGRWCERIQEMISRSPVAVSLSNVRPARTALAGGIPVDERPIGSRDPRGLLVPLEWPPPKGSSGAGPPKEQKPLASESELDQFAKTG
jgi:hypothetical protein